MPFDTGTVDFSASGLTVGKIEAAAVLGASPETRTFSSLIAAVGVRTLFDDGETDYRDAKSS